MLAEGLRSMARQLVAAAGFPRLLVGSYNNRDQQGREKGGMRRRTKFPGGLSMKWVSSARLHQMQFMACNSLT